jgi:hypothetical protein
MTISFGGKKTMSHNGFAGGSWNNKHTLTLQSDEYIKRVEAFHIASGWVKNELAKIVYYTSKDRMVSCHYDRVRYRTNRAVFKAPQGEYIQHIQQYEDKRKCCGRVTGVVTAKFHLETQEALDEQMECKAYDFMTRDENDQRSCKACPAGQKQDPEDKTKCTLSCNDYERIDETGTKCVQETCTQFERLTKKGECETCPAFKPKPTQAQQTQLNSLKAPKPVKLMNAKLSSQWKWKHRGMYLKAENAIDGNKDSFAHTRMGRGHWWYASFEGGDKLVTGVRIQNRMDCCGDRLRKTQVYIGRSYCGALPDKTYTKRSYYVQCKSPVQGNSITIRQNTTYTALQLAEVVVFGDDNCGHDESKNSRGPHKCRASHECAGARTCSRWGWCQGTDKCPKKAEAVLPPRKHYTYDYYGAGKCEDQDEDLGEKMENKDKNKNGCAEAAADAGAEFFMISTDPTQPVCMTCKGQKVTGTNKMTTKVFQDKQFSFYQIKPNFPAFLQAARPTDECELSCGPYQELVNEQCQDLPKCKNAMFRAPTGQCEKCPEGEKVDPSDNKRCIEYECKYKNCSDYRGKQNKSRSGKECKKWDENFFKLPGSNEGVMPECSKCGKNTKPECGNLDCQKTCNWCSKKWGPENPLTKKDRDLGMDLNQPHNFCRNPDPNNSEGNTIWCHVDSQKGWEYCDPKGVVAGPSPWNRVYFYDIANG